MRRHAPLDLAARFLQTHLGAGGKALYALLRAAGDNHNFVEAVAHAGLKDQRRLNHHDGIRLIAGDLIHPLGFALDHRRMHQPVQLLHHVATEGLFRQFAPANAAICFDDVRAKMFHYFGINRLARLHEFAGELVGIVDLGPVAGQHKGHGGFATGQSSGQSNAQHVSVTPPSAGVLPTAATSWP